MFHLFLKELIVCLSDVGCVSALTIKEHASVSVSFSLQFGYFSYSCCNTWHLSLPLFFFSQGYVLVKIICNWTIYSQIFIFSCQTTEPCFSHFHSVILTNNTDHCCLLSLPISLSVFFVLVSPFLLLYLWCCVGCVLSCPFVLNHVVFFSIFFVL